MTSPAKPTLDEDGGTEKLFIAYETASWCSNLAGFSIPRMTSTFLSPLRPEQFPLVKQKADLIQGLTCIPLCRFTERRFKRHKGHMVVDACILTAATAISIMAP